MPDNRKDLKERLGELELGPQREEEILHELGDHVEDHASALESRGVSSDAAARNALESVSNWPALRREILAAETEEAHMNNRTKVLWLPALVALTLSNVLLVLVQVFGPPPHFYWFYIGKSVQAYYVFIIPWLVSQLIVGAIAAFWSRRAGGTLRHQLLAALSPAIALMGLFLLTLPFAIVLGKHVTHSYQLAALSALVVTWVIVPSLPLLLGAVPFLRKQGSHQSSVVGS